ncbi:MAG: hypothetical protein IJ555_07575 [Ruminococcus sp.]|nr:hypothetical protein [Ruminococcus sp.]
MNFFEQELRKVCALSEYIERPKFVGRSCLFRLTDETIGKLEFVTQKITDHFDALRVSVISRTEGQIDSQIINLTELIGKKQHYDSMVEPHIWSDNGRPRWFGFTPDGHDYTAMAESTDDYLSCFSDHEMTEDEGLSIDLK